MTAMQLLTKAQILESTDMVFEDVPTPEWAPAGTPDEEKQNFGVRIRNLTGAGRGYFIKKSIEMKKAQDSGGDVGMGPFEVEMLLVCETAVDAEGNKLFERDDLVALSGRNADPITRCAAVASRLAGMTKQKQEEAAKK